MDTERLDALIAKLEGASEGSRELDAAVGVACGLVPRRTQRYAAREWPRRPTSVRLGWPRLTTSLDAALTLVPEGCWPWLSVYHQGSFGAHAKLYGPRIVHGVAHLTPANAADYRNATDLWPLAICIASLKARREACR